MKIKITVALVLATLALTVSGASAAMSTRIPETPSQIQEPGSTSDFDTYSFQEPTGVYDVVVPATDGQAGFPWGAAAVGGAFVLGLCLVGAGARVALRRRALREQHQS